MTTDKQQVVLLLVEDDPAMRSLLCDELWDLGYRLIEAADGDEALKHVIDVAPPDLILTDLRMPAGGLDYVARLRRFAPKTPIILMTAFGDAKTKAQAQALGITEYFDKPVRIGELKAAIERILPHGEGSPKP